MQITIRRSLSDPTALCATYGLILTKDVDFRANFNLVEEVSIPEQQAIRVYRHGILLGELKNVDVSVDSYLLTIEKST